jgi:hypothetical protein
MNQGDRNPLLLVGKYYQTLEAEITQIKAGELPLETARVVQRHRALELKAFELQIRAVRESRAQRVSNRELNLLTGRIEDITTGSDLTSETRVA